MKINRKKLEKIILEEIYLARQEMLDENFLRNLVYNIDNITTSFKRKKDMLVKKIAPLLQKKPTEADQFEAERIAYNWKRYLDSLGDNPEKMGNMLKKLTKGVSYTVILLAAAFITVEVPRAIKVDKTLADVVEKAKVDYYAGTYKYSDLEPEEIQSRINTLKRSSGTKMLYKRGSPQQVSMQDDEKQRELDDLTRALEIKTGAYKPMGNRPAKSAFARQGVPYPGK